MDPHPEAPAGPCLQRGAAPRKARRPPGLPLSRQAPPRVFAPGTDAVGSVILFLFTGLFVGFLVFFPTP